MDWFDASLYPDEPAAPVPSTAAERIDYVARVCAAWDFGLLPRPRTVEELRRSEWRDAVDACRMASSIAYHLLRRLHGLPEVPFLGSIPTCVTRDPSLRFV